MLYKATINNPNICPKFLPFASNKAVIIPTIEHIVVNKSDLNIIPTKLTNITLPNSNIFSSLVQSLKY